jgi:hypothetical protein
LRFAASGGERGGSYREIVERDDLADALREGITRSLKKAKVKKGQFDAMIANYGFIRTNISVKEYLEVVWSGTEKSRPSRAMNHTVRLPPCRRTAS